MRGKIAIVMLAGLVSACAPTTKWANVDNAMVAAEREKQMELAAESYLKEVGRLEDVSTKVLMGATALCGEKVKPIVGAAWMSKNEASGGMKEAIIKRFGLTDNAMKAVMVAANSPAAVAGLKVGDELVSFNGTKATTKKQFADVALAALKDKGKWPVKIAVLRDGKMVDISVTPKDSCDYPVELADQDIVNAFADGKKIYVTKGMMRFINDDRELALVISHELAHNTMGHIDKKRGNAMIGGLVDVLAAAYGVNTQGAFSKMTGAAYSQDFEMEADYVGLYAMALSGAEVDGVANFWRRLGAANPGSIGQQGYFSSHPSSPERFLAIEKAAAEIKAKRLAGKPLRPEMKESEQANKSGEQVSRAE
jgi:Zn-dependent protease with chaperone function